MTSDTTPAPYIAVASSTLSASYKAWRAFDGLHEESVWASANVPLPAWLAVGIGDAQVACRYALRCGSANYPTDWTFEGSNNGMDWDILDTQEDQILQFYYDWYKDIDNTTAYKYYQLTFTGTSDDIIVIGEFRIYTTSVLTDVVQSGIVAFAR